MRGDRYRAAIGRLFDAKNPEFRFHWHYTPPGCSVSPHCDSRREFGSHIWYFKGVPSRLGYLLDMSPKELEKVIYFAAYLITYVDDELDASGRQRDLELLSDEVLIEEARAIAEYAIPETVKQKMLFTGYIPRRQPNRKAAQRILDHRKRDPKASAGLAMCDAAMSLECTRCDAAPPRPSRPSNGRWASGWVMRPTP